MHALLQRLQGGDRRSVRGVAEVVAQVLAQPRSFAVVFNGMTDADRLVRMRCADAVEKITARRPDLLRPFRRQVLQLARQAREQETRWHLAQLLSRLVWTRAQRRELVTLLSGYTNDQSRIVRTFAMQAMADLAVRDDSLRGAVIERLKELTATGSPAMQSRGRRLLAQLCEEKGENHA